MEFSPFSSSKRIRGDGQLESLMAVLNTSRHLAETQRKDIRSISSKHMNRISKFSKRLTKDIIQMFDKEKRVENV